MRVIAWTHHLGADLGPRCRRGGGERRRAPGSGKDQAQPQVAGGLALWLRRSGSAGQEGSAPLACVPEVLRGEALALVCFLEPSGGFLGPRPHLHQAKLFDL
jgi:hypothetical protein